MKTETKYLSDWAMTETIRIKLKGDKHHKDTILEEWFDETAKDFRNAKSIDEFVTKVNKWLNHYKLPIKVISFTEEDGDEESIEWQVEIYSHD